MRKGRRGLGRATWWLACLCCPLVATCGLAGSWSRKWLGNERLVFPCPAPRVSLILLL